MVWPISRAGYFYSLLQTDFISRRFWVELVHKRRLARARPSVLHSVFLPDLERNVIGHDRKSRQKGSELGRPLNGRVDFLYEMSCRGILRSGVLESEVSILSGRSISAESLLPSGFASKCWEQSKQRVQSSETVPKNNRSQLHLPKRSRLYFSKFKKDFFK